MQRITYVQESLNKNVITRWALNCMPIAVYIAPFRFYSAKTEDYKYRQIVKNAFDLWRSASKSLVSFVFVENLHSSQINIEWRRVERKSLGQCNFNFDGLGRLYSAEIQIGISDGIIHHQYMDENEVFHTVLHEIGHSLGLGHSPFKTDIMYTPHQYGVTQLSAGDIQTLKWLYKFESGKTPEEIMLKYGIPASNLDELILKLKEQKSDFEKVKDEIKLYKKDLLAEAHNIGELKKYNLALQNIKISDEIIKKLRK